MKTLITSIVAMFIFATATASNFEGIKIATTGKSTINAKFSSDKATTATISITNKAGVVVNTQNVTIAKGDNSIVLLDVATLAEGNYTVTLVSNGNTTTTSFLNFVSDAQGL
jgi:hypothetical protein